MANSYYNYSSGTPVAISRGTSALLRSEFTLIGQGFDAVSSAFAARNAAVDASLAAKGAIAGQTWTGTHDYTGGTIKVPTLAYGASGTFAASVDFVNAALLNAAYNLPGQAGNAGKALITNGTTATWTQIYPTQTGKANRVLRTDGANVSWLPGGDLVITGNGTIDFGSYLIAGNYTITLPDMTAGLPLVLSVPSNGASVPSTLTTSNGWSITTGFAAGTAATIMPLRTDTPHGWWGNLSMSPPKIGAPATVLGGAGTSPIIQSSVQLSATCVVYAVADTSAAGISLVAIDPTTGAVGNVVALTAIGAANASNATMASLFSVGATGFAFVYNDAANKAAVYAATMSGLTITGATTFLTATANVVLVDTAVQFGTSATFLAAFTSATASADLVAFSVSGTSVTVGTAIGSGAPASCTATRIAPLTATTALVFYPTSSSGTGGGTHNARVVTLSGLTLAAGTVATTNLSTMYQNIAGRSTLVPFGSNAFLYGVQEYTTPTNNDWFLVTVSGTTVTINNGVVSTVAAAASAIRNINLASIARGINTATARRYTYAVDTTHILLLTGSNFVMASYSGSTLSFSSATATTFNTFLTDVTGANLYATQTSSGTTFSKLTFSAGALNVGTAVAAWPSSVINDNLNDAAVNYGGTWYKWTGVPAAAIPLASDKYINLSGTTLTVYGSFA